MIKNGSSYTMAELFKYFAGVTGELFGKVTVVREEGQYYDYLIVTDRK